ncbi:hypothetical protein HMPREF1553_00598 [Porphyromonas gingivalis F0568]|nr:hypothetical protein HMPREF1553_00598 [Porphyromonas gingivalis F0568]
MQSVSIIRRLCRRIAVLRPKTHGAWGEKTWRGIFFVLVRE